MEPVVGSSVLSGHATPQDAAGGGLAKAGMGLGISAACLMVLGLIPCLGWLNWFVLILAGIAKILCWVAVFTERSSIARNHAVIGLVACFLALLIGFFRLVLGGGCL
jgi:hypothetical protein